MPIFVLVLLLVWLVTALAAVGLCVHARRLDDEIAESEIAPVIDIRSAA